MKRKAAAFGFAFALAELAAAYLPLPAVLPAAAVFVVLAVLAACRVLRPKAGAARTKVPAAPGRVRPGSPAALLLTGTAAGMVFFLGFYALRVRPVLAFDGAEGQCTVTVQTDCEPSYVEGMRRATLHVTELEGRPVDFYAYCALFPDSEPGERFAARFSFAALENDAYRAGRNAKGIYLCAQYLDGFRSAGPAAGAGFWLYRLRKSLSASLRRWMPGREGGVAAALLLGDRSLLEPSVTDAFRAAGASHLLAVSGLHILLLCGVLAGSGTPSERFSRPRILLQALLVLFYMGLTGFSASVVRAGFVFLVAQAGCWFLQPPDTLTSMGIAALALSVFGSAYLPCDVGFQLSFVAAGAMQLSAAAVRGLRQALNGGRRITPQQKTWSDLARGALPGWLGGILGTAFASAATLPVLVAHGMAVSGVAVLTNLLVVWMLQPILRLALLVLGLSLLPAAAPGVHALSLLLGFCIRVLCSAVEWCAGLPMAKLQLPREYTLFACGVLAALWLGLKYAPRPAALGWRLGLTGTAAVVAVAAGAAFSRGVVRIALVGSTANPCAVVFQNGEAAVLYRGGAANLRAVEAELQKSGVQPGQAMYLDLRQVPKALDFTAGTLYTLEEQAEFYRSIPLLPDVSADCYHTRGGSLAVLDVGGYHIAMSAGTLELEAPACVDLYLAGGSYPNCVQANAVLSCTASPRWLDRLEREALLYGGEAPQILLRPGRSVSYREVKEHAVQ